jgi:adiponectin receptor
MFMRHNETCNIWTHLVGLGIFVALTASMACDWGRYRMPRLPDAWPFGGESFESTKLAICGRLQEFATAVEDTRRRIVDASDEPGERMSPTARDAARTLTEAATHLREHLWLQDNFDALRMTVDAAAASIVKTSYGLEHDTIESLNSELGNLYAHLELAHDLICVAGKASRDLDVAPRWPVYVFLSAATVCLGMSNVCHTLTNVTERVSAILWRLDYVGIAWLIVASFFPIVYYPFMCMPTWRWIYLTGNRNTSSDAAGKVSGAAVLVYARHALLFPGWQRDVAHLSPDIFTWQALPSPILHMLSMELLMGACYLTGAVIYSAAIPEKWMPGMFDTWGHSHNIFHVLVVCGVYAHYRAALSLMAWRDHHGCETDVTLLKRWYIDNGWIGYMLPGGWMEYAQSAMGAAVHEELRLQMSAGSSDEQRTTAAICRAVYQVIGRVSLSG